MLRVTKERTPLNSTYKVKGQELAELSTSKYLVVDLSSNLDWKEHIDRTVKKANKALGFLRPNHLPMSHLSVQTWNTVPLFGVLIQTNPSRNWRWFKEDQLGTAPMDTTTQVVTYMLQDLNWETLESRRTKLQLVIVYKIMDDLVDIPPDTYLTPAATQIRAIHSKKL